MPAYSYVKDQFERVLFESGMKSVTREWAEKSGRSIIKEDENSERLVITVGANTETLHYVTECDPKSTGVYACRVPSEVFGLLQDEFLMWTNGSWWYLGSDQRYRGKVLGWIGPLQRKMDVVY